VILRTGLFKKQAPLRTKELNVLFVCRANVTRSPFLAALFQKKIETCFPQHLQRVSVHSAGVEALRNASTDHVICEWAEKYGLDLQDHRARPVTSALIRSADLILTAEEAFAHQLQARFGDDAGVILPLPMFGNSDLQRSNWDVLDPTGREESDYARFVETAEAETDRLIHLLEGDITGRRDNLVLIGLPGAGKTTAGKRTAARLGVSFLDTDDLIEEQEACSLQEIVDQRGYHELRTIEASVISTCAVERTVIATGGSVVYSTDAMTQLRRYGVVVNLLTDEEQLLQRLGSGEGRGLAKPEHQSLKDVMRERSSLYPRWAHRNISTDLPVEETVEMLVSIWKSEIAG
jgi:shikimate kinase